MRGNTTRILSFFSPLPRSTFMKARWLRHLGQFTSQNSPVILSGIAVGGVIATAVLAVKATPKAMKSLEKLEGENPSTLEKAEKVWKFYVPAGLSGAATIACIIGANTIGMKRNAALVAAYTLVDSTFREYKDHVIAEIGDQKERKIHDKIMTDRLENNPPDSTQVIVVSGGDQLCYDSLTGRYFKSDIEKIRRAENEINRRILNDMYAAQNEFYDLVGLPYTTIGDELGWNIDCMVDLRFTSHLREDTGEPCLAIGYNRLPIKDYGKVF
jgi:Family of unknown function (DUF6353)